MAINNVLVRRQGKSNGSGIGGVLGAIAGAIAAPFTAGASLAAIPAAVGTGAGIGHTVGSTIGGLAAPGKAAETEVPVKTSSAMKDRLAKQESAPPPESQILKDSLQALHDSEDDDLRQSYGEPLFNAYNMAMKKERGGRIT